MQFLHVSNGTDSTWNIVPMILKNSYCKILYYYYSFFPVNVLYCALLVKKTLLSSRHACYGLCVISISPYFIRNTVYSNTGNQRILY